jgi:hypothetical protein
MNETNLTVRLFHIGIGRSNQELLNLLRIVTSKIMTRGQFELAINC